MWSTPTVPTLCLCTCVCVCVCVRLCVSVIVIDCVHPAVDIKHPICVYRRKICKISLSLVSVPVLPRPVCNTLKLRVPQSAGNLRFHTLSDFPTRGLSIKKGEMGGYFHKPKSAP